MPSPESDTLIDGRPGDSIDVADRGLNYGDGLFETISCQRGKPRWLALHMERLRAGLNRLQLPFTHFDALRDEIGRLSRDQERCIVKVIITRGAATRRGYAPSGDERPIRIVSRHQWPIERAADSFRVGVSDVRLGMNPLLGGLKHLNRLEQVLARMRCVEAGLDEALMLSATGQVISGTMSNVFFADESGVFTPQLTQCGVEGIMRRVVLRTAQQLDLEVQVRAVEARELAGVREIFLTNVRLGVQSVRWFEGRCLGEGHHAQQLRDVIDETDA